jgi:hypothetical protein
MQHALYDGSELVPFYRLLDAYEDHAEEGVSFTADFERACAFRPETLLELGAGAGNNGFHLKRRFRCTLTDISASMLGLSRELNPDCEHVQGDLRTLRLERTFDAVLIHDAICYMTSPDDLRAAAATAFVHTRPGGAAIIAPDCLRETFAEHTELHEGNGGGRSLRALEWAWDPDPNDTTYTVEYAFLLREGTAMKAVHDRHVEGLFPRATWLSVLREAGYAVETTPRPLGDGAFDEAFLCRRPA